jgi:hypothetical protein
MASSSNPEPMMEERLSELQSELDRIKIQAKEQSNLMLNMDIVGANCWESLNQELKSIIDDVNNDVEANFKGMEKVLVTLQHCVSKLEAKVEEISKSWAKDTKPQDSSDEDWNAQSMFQSIYFLFLFQFMFQSAVAKPSTSFSPKESFYPLEFSTKNLRFLIEQASPYVVLLWNVKHPTTYLSDLNL